MTEPNTETMAELYVLGALITEILARSPNLDAIEKAMEQRLENLTRTAYEDKPVMPYVHAYLREVQDRIEHELQNARGIQGSHKDPVDHGDMRMTETVEDIVETLVEMTNFNKEAIKTVSFDTAGQFSFLTKALGAIIRNSNESDRIWDDIQPYRGLYENMIAEANLNKTHDNFALGGMKALDNLAKEVFG